MFRTALRFTLPVGIKVHPAPVPALSSIYTSTLETLAKFPASSVYRQGTEALTRHRAGLLQNEGVTALERDANMSVEETINVAQKEHELAEKMLQWKV